ncbi:MAG: helix-turn-helix domain-containing protein [Gemmatimonadaceae bacterium]
MPLPSAWSAEILHALAALIAGRGVAWSSNTETEDEIGTGELAEMLGVSPPTVVAMLDSGEISMRLTPGGHRRVRRADVLQWRVRREIQRRSLRELVQMAERDESEGSSLPSSVQQDPDDE